MQKVACPGCGAEVVFRSAASVMAVCGYCRTAVLKDAAAVRDIGKIAPVFEDYSQLQIGAGGRWEKAGFTVVGRIQLRYGAGYWNEWRVLLDDGSEAWLSDASGQYAFTTLRKTEQALPHFAQLHPGVACTFAGNRYVASDVREARCAAGEGELPFRVGAGRVLKAADFRWRDRFLTFDYSDSDTPVVYAGRSVTLEELGCQLLRSPDEVKDAAGRYRGTTVALSCPACGSGIEYRTGMATHVVCANCHAELDCTDGKAGVLAKHAEVESVATTLRAGDEGRIDGGKWTVIGLACHKEAGADEPSTWVEYLLFNAKLGFMWLVETSDGWSRVKVLDVWPEPAGTGWRFLGDVCEKLYDEYVGEITYAAGNFNWQVQVGDRVSITDYGRGGKRITEEKTQDEITWSLAREVKEEEVLKWFGKTEADEVEPAGTASSPISRSSGKWPAFAVGWPVPVAWVLLAVLNLPLLFSESVDTAFFVAMVAAWLVYLPVQIANKFAGGTQE